MKAVIPPPLKTLDPVTIYDQGGIVLVYQIAEYLIDLTNENALKPKLAVSWAPNPKGDVWTFKLRQGVTFNDGSPFEAADVVDVTLREDNVAHRRGVNSVEVRPVHRSLEAHPGVDDHPALAGG